MKYTPPDLTRPLQAEIAARIAGDAALAGISADFDVYIDQATGDDTNAGTVGAPWETLNHAFATIRNYRLNGHKVTLHVVGDSSATGNVTIGNLTGNVAITGDKTTFNDGYLLIQPSNGGATPGLAFASTLALGSTCYAVWDGGYAEFTRIEGDGGLRLTGAIFGSYIGEFAAQYLDAKNSSSTDIYISAFFATGLKLSPCVQHSGTGEVYIQNITTTNLVSSIAQFIVRGAAKVTVAAKVDNGAPGDMNCPIPYDIDGSGSVSLPVEFFESQVGVGGVARPTPITTPARAGRETVVATLNTATDTPTETKTISSVSYNIFVVPFTHALTGPKGVTVRGVAEALGGGTPFFPNISSYIVDKDYQGIDLTGSTSNVGTDVGRYGSTFNVVGGSVGGSIPTGGDYAQITPREQGGVPAGKLTRVNNVLGTVVSNTKTMNWVVYVRADRITQLNQRLTLEFTEIT